jgi:hypothetical protein
MGGIPPTFGNYSHFNTLNLSTNLLMRLIPNELGELSKLIVLDFLYNVFRSEIPYSILSKLPLENLDVSYNLFGVLPLGFLVVIDAKGNLDLGDVANNCEANRQQISSKLRAWNDGINSGWNFCGNNNYIRYWFMLLLLEVSKSQQIAQGAFTKQLVALDFIPKGDSVGV